MTWQLQYATCVYSGAAYQFCNLNSPQRSGAHWAQVIDDAGGYTSAVLAGFSASNESQALYGSSTTAQKVAAI